MKENAKYIPTDEYNPFVVYSVTPDPERVIMPELYSRLGSYPTLADAQTAGERFKDDYEGFVIIQVRAISVKPSFWKEYK